LYAPACGGVKSIRLGSLTRLVMVEFPVSVQVESTSVTLEVLPASVIAAPVKVALRADTLAVAGEPACTAAMLIPGGLPLSGARLGSMPCNVRALLLKRLPELATCSQLVAPWTVVPFSSTSAVPPSMPMAVPVALVMLPPLMAALCVPVSLVSSRPTDCAPLTPMALPVAAKVEVPATTTPWAWTPDVCTEPASNTTLLPAPCARIPYPPCPLVTTVLRVAWNSVTGLPLPV
jgi:hypothetical protein